MTVVTILPYIIVALIAIGIGYVLGKLFGDSDAIKNNKDLDSTITNIGVFVYAFVLTGCIFISDWFFNTSLLTDSLIGIMIGAPLGWVGNIVANFFQKKKNGEIE